MNKTPYDRGAADSYYSRGICPHFILDGKRIEDLTEDQKKSYLKGYSENEEIGNKKKY